MPFWSPDGRFVASLQEEVRPDSSRTWTMQPRWREDGHELYYLAPDGKMMVVEVSGGESLETSPPIVLFQTDLRPDPVVDQYDVTGDGQRFLIAKPVGAPTKPITAILNWMAGAPR